MSPNSLNVRNALLSRKGEEKLNGYLGKYIDGRKCFCIEGLFCEVAVELGFEGKFIERKALTERETAFSLNIKGAWHGGWAPLEIFTFLGMPRKVKYSDIKAAGVKLTEKTEESFKGMASISWHTLNDDTDITLDALIDLAVKQLP